MTAPRKGSVDGLHGMPRIHGKMIRVFVDGDMPRGVVSFDGENFVTQRLIGKVEARGA